MIDPDAFKAKPEDRVGRAVVIKKGIQNPTAYVVPVWRSDGADMGQDQSVSRKRLYYLQNNYQDGKAML